MFSIIVPNADDSTLKAGGAVPVTVNGEKVRLRRKNGHLIYKDCDGNRHKCRIFYREEAVDCNGVPCVSYCCASNAREAAEIETDDRPIQTVYVSPDDADSLDRDTDNQSAAEMYITCSGGEVPQSSDQGQFIVFGNAAGDDLNEFFRVTIKKARPDLRHLRSLRLRVTSVESCGGMNSQIVSLTAVDTNVSIPVVIVTPSIHLRELGVDRVVGAYCLLHDSSPNLSKDPNNE